MQFKTGDKVRSQIDSVEGIFISIDKIKTHATILVEGNPSRFEVYHIKDLIKKDDLLLLICLGELEQVNQGLRL